MGFFNWAAPMFHRADSRWTTEDVDAISGWLRPSLPSGGRLLDVGGGTGGLATRLASALDAKVTVLDPTPEMVAYVSTEAGIEVVLGRAESIPLPAASVHAILVSDAFHHFRDQPAAVTEFARVLKLGGGVLVLDLDPSGLGVRVVGAIERLLGEPAAFLSPDQMVGLMAAHGITGTTERKRGSSYRFLGRRE